MKKVALALLVLVTIAGYSFAGLTYTDTSSPNPYGGTLMSYTVDDDVNGWTATVQEITNSKVASNRLDPDFATFHVTIAADTTSTTANISTLADITTTGTVRQIWQYVEEWYPDPEERNPTLLYGYPVADTNGNTNDSEKYQDSAILIDQIAEHGNGYLDLGMLTEDNNELDGVCTGYGNIYGALAPSWKDINDDGVVETPDNWKTMDPSEWEQWRGQENEPTFDVISNSTAYAITGGSAESITFIQICVPREGLLVPDGTLVPVAELSGAYTNKPAADLSLPLVNFGFAIGATEPVPEPSTIIMIVLGALCLVGARLRRK